MSKPLHHLPRKHRAFALGRQESMRRAAAGADAMSQALGYITGWGANANRDVSINAEGSIIAGPLNPIIRARYRDVMRDTEALGIEAFCLHVHLLWLGNRETVDRYNALKLGPALRYSWQIAEARLISRWIRRHAARQWPGIRAAMLSDPVLVRERNAALAPALIAAE